MHGGKQRLKRHHIARRRCGQRGFDQMIAGNDGGVGGKQPFGRLRSQSRPPARQPVQQARRIGEQRRQQIGVLRRKCQSPERQRPVRALRFHYRQQVLGKLKIAVLFARQPQLAAHHRQPFVLIHSGHATQAVIGQIHRAVGVGIKKRQQRFRQPRQVPAKDKRLICIGIPTLPINRGKHRAGGVGLDERAGAVVDGLAGQRHIVGVHHAVHKSQAHPKCHQPRLPRHHRIEQRQCRGIGGGRIREVARNGVLQQGGQSGGLIPIGEKLKGADADVTGGNARHHSTGQRALIAQNCLTRGGHRQTTGARHPKCRHRLRDQIFAQHRPKRRPTVAATRKPGATGAFQLQVPPATIRPQKLAQKMRAAIAKLR